MQNSNYKRDRTLEDQTITLNYEERALLRRILTQYCEKAENPVDEEIAANILEKTKRS